MEGTRPLTIDVQALVAPSELAMPRRLASGFDRNRLSLLLAVLARHGGLALGQHDVFVNVAGGVRVDEPAADLAVALALVSAARGVALGPVCAFGEIALTGRLRPGRSPSAGWARRRRLGPRGPDRAARVRRPERRRCTVHAAWRVGCRRRVVPFGVEVWRRGSRSLGGGSWGFGSVRGGGRRGEAGGSGVGMRRQTVISGAARRADGASSSAAGAWATAVR